MLVAHPVIISESLTVPDFDTMRRLHYTFSVRGGMAEWTNAAVLKTAMAPCVIGGSNPSPSVLVTMVSDLRWIVTNRNRGEVAEWSKAPAC